MKTEIVPVVRITCDNDPEQCFYLPSAIQNHVIRAAESDHGVSIVQIPTDAVVPQACRIAAQKLYLVTVDMVYDDGVCMSWLFWVVDINEMYAKILARREKMEKLFLETVLRDEEGRTVKVGEKTQYLKDVPELTIAQLRWSIDNSYIDGDSWPSIEITFYSSEDIELA